MKALIWIVCCATPTIIKWTFEEFGLTFTPITFALLQAGGVFLALVLCKKWDWHQAEKKAAEAGMTVSEYGRHGLSKEFLDDLEKKCKTWSYDLVKSELKSYVKEGKITKEQCLILLKEYSTTK
jgi:hypothetical protein